MYSGSKIYAQNFGNSERLKQINREAIYKLISGSTNFHILIQSQGYKFIEIHGRFWMSRKLLFFKRLKGKFVN